MVVSSGDWRTSERAAANQLRPLSSSAFGQVREKERGEGRLSGNQNGRLFVFLSVGRKLNRAASERTGGQIKQVAVVALATRSPQTTGKCFHLAACNLSRKLLLLSAASLSSYHHRTCCVYLTFAPSSQHFMRDSIGAVGCSDRLLLGSAEIKLNWRVLEKHVIPNRLVPFCSEPIILLILRGAKFRSKRVHLYVNCMHSAIGLLPPPQLAGRHTPLSSKPNGVMSQSFGRI